MIRKNRPDDRIIVIGSGLGGLAAACTLATRGHRVTLLEKNAWLGGKAAELHDGGFRFDMGPTILTLPRVLKRIFDEAGRDLNDYLNLVRLDPQWRCFFEDGSVLDLREDLGEMKDTLERFTGSMTCGQQYQRFLGLAERLHDISERFFFWRPIGGIGDMFDAGNSFSLSTLSDVLAMRMGRSVGSTIRSFVDDPRVAQMLDHFTQYVGSSPEASPAVLCGIAHMQTNDGVWYPMGGTRAVPTALTKLAEDLGVDCRTGVDIGQIDTANGRVTGVTTVDGEHIAAGAVVSNMDAVRTMQELVGGKPAERFGAKHRKLEAACSGVVLYLGLKERYDHLAHHDFVFSRDPHEEFDAIYERGEPAPDPTCYLAAPAQTDSEVAPIGGEALYVLVHTPYMRPHHDWSRDGRLFRDYRRTILEKLKRTAGMEDIEDRIVVEQALTPQDIHDRYRVLNGAIYGVASHGRFTGAFKPNNRSTFVDGLYLAGGSAHPGPGMPMVMMSGWIAADTLDRDSVVAKSPSAEEAALPDEDAELVKG